MTDPQIRDEVINLSCPNHDPAACQEADCSWCDNAADRADAVHRVFVDWLGSNGHDAAATDLLAAWHGFRMPRGQTDTSAIEQELREAFRRTAIATPADNAAALQRLYDDSEGFRDRS